MKKVPLKYTQSMTIIYLSLRAQVAEGTFFRKSPVFYTEILNIKCRQSYTIYQIKPFFFMELSAV